MARDFGVPVTTEGNYCFISYNSEDCEAVGEIVRGLHQAGIPLWYDNGIDEGKNYHKVIAERIDKCSCVLIFFTENILKKGEHSYVYGEYELAIDFSEKPVYIVMMDEINKKNVPYAIRKWYADLCRLQNINAFEFTLEQTVQKICEAVSRDVNLNVINPEIDQKKYNVSDINENGMSEAKTFNERGDDYFFGRNDFKKNDTEAVKWYQKAANMGFAPAQYNLGYCYRFGRGIKQNDAEAVKWYQKSAEQGNVSAQIYMGQCYEHGRGVGQNNTEAVKWYQKAADQENFSAQKMLKDFLEKTTVTTKKYDINNENGMTEAKTFNERGDDYFFGRNDDCKKNDTEAVKWYQKAANMGFAPAQYNLGYCYRFGKGIKQNEAEAVKWYQKAAEQGNISAQIYMGQCYEHGRGVERNNTEAIKWYQKAADQGNVGAKDALKRLGQY